MGVISVMTYLRVLREQQKFSQSDLAKAMGVSLRQEQRYEGGEVNSFKMEYLVRAMAFLKASVDHINLLFEQPDVDPETAQRLALDWMSDRQQREIREAAAAYGSTTIEDAAKRFQEMSSQALIGLIARASQELEERQNSPRIEPETQQSLRQQQPA